MINKQDVEAVDAALQLQHEPQALTDTLNALLSAHTCCSGEESPLAREIESLALLAADYLVEPDPQRWQTLVVGLKKVRPKL